MKQLDWFGRILSLLILILCVGAWIFFENGMKRAGALTDAVVIVCALILIFRPEKKGKTQT